MFILKEVYCTAVEAVKQMNLLSYKFLTKSDIKTEITGAQHTLMEDDRVFCSVYKCLDTLGYRAAVNSDGNLLLIANQKAYNCSFAKMLYLCRDFYRKEQVRTRDWYQKMCTEENEEEIELLLEVYHLTHTSPETKVSKNRLLYVKPAQNFCSSYPDPDAIKYPEYLRY